MPSAPDAGPESPSCGRTRSRPRCSPRHGTTSGPGRSANRDRRRPRRAVARVAGALRAHARPRARSHRQAAAARSGTELRRHQVDALAGMLTALITANQRELEEANRLEALPEGEDEENGDLSAYADENGRVEVVDEETEPSVKTGRGAPLPLPSPDGLREDDRGGGLRGGRTYRRRPHPHAPPAARQPIHSRADRRGLRRPAHARDPPGQQAADLEPDHHPDVRVVRPPRRRSQPRGVPPRDRGRSPQALGEKTSAAIRSFPTRSTSA